MPTKSPEQKRLMQAAANDPEFAKKIGIPHSVAQEIIDADTRKATKQKKPKK